MTRIELEKTLGVEVEDDPFCIGYWLRIAGQRRPRNEDRRAGWEQADRELKAEAK